MSCYFYNVPKYIAKGMSTNQIPATEENLKALPQILGEDAYQSFKQELAHIEKEYPNQIQFTINKNDRISKIEPYKGTYEKESGQLEVSNLDLKYKDKINEFDIRKDQDSRPIAAHIQSGVEWSEMDVNEPENAIGKKYENFLSKEEQENFKQAYLRVEETLEHPNGGLNYTQYDKDTQKMMESYHRLQAHGHLASDFNVYRMTDIIQYNMEQNLEKTLEKRAEKSLTKDNDKKVTLSISKPKEKGGLER